MRDGVPPRITEFLDDQEWERVRASAPSRSYRRNEIIFLEGDPGTCLYVIDRGRVAIRKTTPTGREVTLTVLGAGDTFGEQALLRPGARRTAAAVTLTPVTLRVLQREVFLELRATDPGFDHFLIDVLAAQVRRLTGQLVDALFASAEGRLASRLLALAAPDLDSDELVITQAELSAMTGLSRQTVNQLLKSFEADELVTVAWGRIGIIDRRGLEDRLD